MHVDFASGLEVPWFMVITKTLKAIITLVKIYVLREQSLIKERHK